MNYYEDIKAWMINNFIIIVSSAKSRSAFAGCLSHFTSYLKPNAKDLDAIFKTHLFSC